VSRDVTSRYLYSSVFEVSLGALAAYDSWYVRHAADLLGVGMRRVHGFRSSRAPRALSNLYELDSLDVFGEGYAAARSRDTLGSTVRPFLSPAELAVFEVVGSAGAVDLSAPGVCLFDIMPAPGQRGVLDWYVRGLAELLDGEGLSGALLGRAVDAPVAPVGAAALRLVVLCATPEQAFRVSDTVPGAYADRWGSPPEFGRIDVLMHRVTLDALDLVEGQPPLRRRRLG
jgi:hypothetical protein